MSIVGPAKTAGAVPMGNPCSEPRMVIRRRRSVAEAIHPTARSIAANPDEVKVTCVNGTGMMKLSASSSSSRRSYSNPGGAVVKASSWPAIASTTRGWLCPSSVLAPLEVRSR